MLIDCRERTAVTPSPRCRCHHRRRCHRHNHHHRHSRRSTTGAAIGVDNLIVQPRHANTMTTTTTNNNINTTITHCRNVHFPPRRALAPAAQCTAWPRPSACCVRSARRFRRAACRTRTTWRAAAAAFASTSRRQCVAWSSENAVTRPPQYQAAGRTALERKSRRSVRVDRILRVWQLLLYLRLVSRSTAYIHQAY